MTSQGSAHARFQRALHRKHLLATETAARELGSLNLTEALDLTLLIRENDRRRYERAAVRWLQRFTEERRPTLAELALAVAAEITIWPGRPRHREAASKRSNVRRSAQDA
jgi:hypothetical protein